jgi:hypothetical protein
VLNPSTSDAGPQPPGVDVDAAVEEPWRRCPDLDDNGELDCEESLVTNASFARDLRGWALEKDGAQWASDDGVENPRSGSLLVTNSQVGEGTSYGFTGVAQCLALPAGSYQVFAQVRIAEQASPGNAGLSLIWYEDETCEGKALNTESLLTILTDQWATVGRRIDVPRRSRGLKLRLGVMKPYDAEPFTARIDNVLVRPE